MKYLKNRLNISNISFFASRLKLYIRCIPLVIYRIYIWFRFSVGWGPVRIFSCFSDGGDSCKESSAWFAQSKGGYFLPVVLSASACLLFSFWEFVELWDWLLFQFSHIDQSGPSELSSWAHRLACSLLVRGWRRGSWGGSRSWRGGEDPRREERISLSYSEVRWVEQNNWGYSRW